MPHKAVVREAAQTTKVRIVHDASEKSRSKNVSLNQCLETVPPLQNLIWDILKSPLLLRNLALVPSGELLIVFSKKVNLLYLLYSTARRCCLLHLIKRNCLLKNFLIGLILMT